MRHTVFSQWGIDFRPEYLQLAAVKQQLKAPTTLALTATATEQVARDIQQNLLGKNASSFSLWNGSQKYWTDR